MDKRWQLRSLYDSYEDEKFKNDMALATELGEQLNTLSRELDKGNEKENILKGIDLFERIEEVYDKLFSFASLQAEADTKDPVHASYLGQLSSMVSRTTKANTVITKYIAECRDLDRYIEEESILKEYEYYLHNLVEDNKYMLTDAAEEVAAKYGISGGDAWSNLQSYLTSSVEVEFRGEKTTLSAVRNMAYDPDETVRKDAYDAELASYEKIKDPVAFALNNIKQQTLSECELRGFESPLSKTLYESRMTQKTLDALLEAMVEYMPNFHRYLKIKGKALGHENGLPWYDMFAPMGKQTKKYTIEEARAYLLNIFEKFNPDMCDIINTAYDREWIDFYPRDGKVGGAFCAGLAPVREFRVLTNFDGSFSSISTLAHELGHGYHDTLTQDNRPLNRGYSMPVAETASTFNENVVAKRAIDSAETDDEKIALLDGELMEVTQIICDIYSRFLFEKEVCDRKSEEFMFPDTLCDIMHRAQVKAYGDGITEDTLNPYMWVCKSHYYGPSLAFYNFPYAFGGLFARGLYLLAEEKGSEFIEVYKDMLRKTPLLSVEDAAKVCGVDVTDKAFWLMSLNSYNGSIDEYEKLIMNR